MKKCPACDSLEASVFGDKFCVFCGGELVEIPEKYYCSNSECSKHKEKMNFSSVCSFCGECGSPIVRSEEIEN